MLRLALWVLLLGSLVVGGGLSPVQATAGPSIAASSSVVLPDESFTVSGSLPSSSVQTLTLQRLDGWSWKNVTDVKSASAFSFTTSTATSATYRVARTTSSFATTSTVNVTAGQRIDLIAPSSTTVRTTLTIAGCLQPVREGRGVSLQVLSGSTWSTVSTAKANSQGKVSFSYTPTAVGQMQLRLVADKVSGSQPITSAVSTIQVAPRPPSLTSVDPAVGPTTGGQSVTLNGSDLDTVTKVTFGGTNATITKKTATAITVTAPARSNPGTVDVSVYSPAGCSPSKSYTYARPTIVSKIDPTRGSVLGGQTVTITGTDLDAATKATFGGTVATITKKTATTLAVTTPAHDAGTVDVIVTAPAGVSVAKTYTYVRPVVTSLDQTRGPVTGGQTVTLTGTDLTGATKATFDGVPATLGANTGTTLKVTAPAHTAGTFDVVVTTPLGTSVAKSYRYAQPVVTTIDPVRGPVAGGQTVTITGTDLDGATAVTVDGTKVAPTNVTGTSLTFTTPAHRSGTVDITVTTPLGTSAAKSYTYATPIVATIDPIRGGAAGGQSVTLTGTDLDGATRVTFDGTAATISKQSSTSITVTTPAHAAGTIDVVVTTPNGTTAPKPFTYVLPVVTTIDPARGTYTGGQSVTLTGTDLGTAVQVTFGGTPGTITKQTDTSLTVMTPAHDAGPVDIVVTTLLGVTAPNTYSYANPTVRTVGPARGGTTGGTLVGLTGTDLDTTSKVTFDGRPAQILAKSNSALTVETPAHAAGPVDVVVTTDFGTTAPVTFTYVRPAITGIDPARGGFAGGDTVTLTGTDLETTNTVTFDGKVAGIVDSTTTSLTVTTPPHESGPVDVVVSTDSGPTAAKTFTYLRPRLTGVDRTRGPAGGGQTIVLTGTDLDGATKVTVDGTTVTPRDVTSTSLAITIPAHAPGAVDLTVTTPFGTTNATRFTYLKPTVASIDPARGPLAGGRTVTLTGTDLDDATKVTIDGTDVQPTDVTSTSLSFTTPAHAAGTVDVVVTTPFGTSNPASYRYARPVVSSADPVRVASAGGQVVTLTGTDLDGTTSVTVDGQSADFTQSSGSSLIVTTPAHAAGPATIVVTTGLGSSEPVTVTYVLPVITQLDPGRSAISGGATVTVAGTDLDSAYEVTVDGTSVAFARTPDGTLTFTAPAHARGDVDVVVRTMLGATAPATLRYLQPSVTSISPSTVEPSRPVNVTLTGLDLDEVKQVTFGTRVATVQSSSSTRVTVTAPADSNKTVDVVVQTAYGTTDPVSFTYRRISLPRFTTILDDPSGPSAGGQTVRLFGQDLEDISRVTFGGALAKIISNTGSVITVEAPAHDPGNVDVYLIGRTALGPKTYRYARPTITSVSPDRGSVNGGQKVTLTGVDLASSPTVTFDGKAATVDPGSNNDATQLTVITPAHAAGAIDVVVTNAYGTSAPQSYTYIQPTVTSLSRDSGDVGGGQSVTLTGSNLSGSIVTFGGVSVPVGAMSDTALTVTTPAHAAGTVDVMVTNGLGSSAPKPFRFARPSVTGIDPKQGSAAPYLDKPVVTLTGSDLDLAQTVLFDGVAGDIQGRSTTSLRVRPPNHDAGTVDVVVTTPLGTTTPVKFAYIESRITSVSPAHGSVQGGQIVTISGTNLDETSSVLFDRSEATILEKTSTSVKVRVPAHAAGPVLVGVITPYSRWFVSPGYFYGDPTITSITPDHGPVSGGQTITITGDGIGGYGGSGVVLIGGRPALPVSSSLDSISVTVPPGSPGPAVVEVQNAFGATARGTYTYDW